MVRSLSWRLIIALAVLVVLVASGCSSESNSLADRSESGEPLELVLYGDSMLTFPEPNRGAIDACIDAILNVVDSFEVFCDIRARDAASEAAARAEEQEP